MTSAPGSLSQTRRRDPVAFRVGHIVASLASKRGGPSRSVLALARAQAGTGACVALAALSEREPPPSPSTNLHLHHGRPDRPLRLAASRDLAGFLEHHAFQALHHHGLWLRPLHYAHQRARKLGAPLILSPRGMMSPWAWQHHRRRKWLAQMLVHPGALDGTAGWHATSTAEADEIRALGFRQPICVAPNGVDLPNEAQLQLAREHWQPRVPDSVHRPIALFHSRLHSKKRVIELIDLWLTTAPRDWRLLIVGLEDEFQVDDVADYVRRARGTDRISVFDGLYRPPPYAIASLFLLPSHSENFGLVVAEAMASGVPVLVTDTTPWSALRAHGAGWWVPWDQFGPALRSACAEDAETLRARGQAGRRWVSRAFVWDEYARRLLDFYTAVTPPSR